jgi:dienelactone hydrolase
MGEQMQYGEETIQIECGSISLKGNVAVPADATGLVLFAHGSGSSRHSPRNRSVARRIQSAGLATVLMDLLTADEERVDILTAHLRFDIPFLAERLICAVDWIGLQPSIQALPLGLFGSSTGAAAALVAAATRPQVRTVVSRGGRPDLAGSALRRVRAPTLLIVGGNDEPVIEMNKAAMGQLPEESSLVIVPRASHLFAEPGTLEEVARLAAEWFSRHLSPHRLSLVT